MHETVSFVTPNREQRHPPGSPSQAEKSCSGLVILGAKEIETTNTKHNPPILENIAEMLLFNVIKDWVVVVLWDEYWRYLRKEGCSLCSESFNFFHLTNNKSKQKIPVSSNTFTEQVLYFYRFISQFSQSL